MIKSQAGKLTVCCYLKIIRTIDKYSFNKAWQHGMNVNDKFQ
jgi:2-phosphoglycerate kinase